MLPQLSCWKCTPPALLQISAKYLILQVFPALIRLEMLSHIGNAHILVGVQTKLRLFKLHSSPLQFYRQHRQRHASHDRDLQQRLQPRQPRGRALGREEQHSYDDGDDQLLIGHPDTSQLDPEASPQQLLWVQQRRPGRERQHAGQQL